MSREPRIPGLRRAIRLPGGPHRARRGRRDRLPSRKPRRRADRAQDSRRSSARRTPKRNSAICAASRRELAPWIGIGAAATAPGSGSTRSRRIFVTRCARFGGRPRSRSPPCSRSSSVSARASRSSRSSTACSSALSHSETPIASSRARTICRRSSLKHEPQAAVDLLYLSATGAHDRRNRRIPRGRSERRRVVNGGASAGARGQCVHIGDAASGPPGLTDFSAVRSRPRTIAPAQPPVMLISESMWRTRFGGRSATSSGTGWT